MSIVLTPLSEIPLVQPGDDLPRLLLAALERAGIELIRGDILVVCQKVVSKSEGRVLDLRTVIPGPLARILARAGTDKDPRLIEVVLRETNRIVRAERGVLIVETGFGWVCANAGVDESNGPGPEYAVLLPTDPDGSARRIQTALHAHAGVDIAVLVTDTWGRPWRNGLIDFAIGTAGIDPLLDLRGTPDLNGRELHHTVFAQADALAAAAGLLMRKNAGIAAVHIRGYAFEPISDATARSLIRPAAEDLFR